jgi:hypothetical protein
LSNKPLYLTCFPPIFTFYVIRNINGKIILIWVSIKREKKLPKLLRDATKLYK